MPRLALPAMIAACRRYGLEPEVVPGAAMRGDAVLNPAVAVGHHTAGPASGDRPSLRICIDGRPDLPGPLCQFFLTRAGVPVIVAAGRANHAGAGGFRGVTGNSGALGCEAESAGVGDWTAAQRYAYPRVVAAMLWLMGRDASWYCSHRTWAPTRKIDPAGIADADMQRWVREVMEQREHEIEGALSMADVDDIRRDIAALRADLQHRTDLIWRGSNPDPDQPDAHRFNLEDIGQNVETQGRALTELAAAVARIEQSLSTPPQ